MGSGGARDWRWVLDAGDVLTAGPRALLGTLELAFILVTEVWSFAALASYKRILGLFCRSAAAVATPETFSDGKEGFAKETRETFIALVDVLAAQIRALPDSAFTTELPDMDTFYVEELGHLGRNLGAALAEPQWWGLAKRALPAWERLEAATKERGWSLAPLPAGDEDDEEGDEEGEYAPVVVEL